MLLSSSAVKLQIFSGRISYAGSSEYFSRWGVYGREGDQSEEVFWHFRSRLCLELRHHSPRTSSSNSLCHLVYEVVASWIWNHQCLKLAELSETIHQSQIICQQSNQELFREWLPIWSRNKTLVLLCKMSHTHKQAKEGYSEGFSGLVNGVLCSRRMHQCSGIFA